MKKQEVQRDYKFSDATLVTKGSEKIAYMRRDVTQFDGYGITELLIDALENSLDLFANRLTDIEALGDQTQITANKDAKGVEIRSAVTNVMGRVELQYGFGSPKYKKFGTDALARQTDSDLLITAKRVVRVGTELLPDLTDNGLTTAMLTAIATMADEFQDLIVEMKIEIGDRDIEQEDRVEAGNAIYNTLVKYTSAGQSIWQASDVARFNDYVLYNTISGEEERTVPPVSIP
jgi:hypothetical protein